MSVLSATGAGVRHHRRWLVRDLDLVVEAGETVAIVGPPGSGRTSTLLALARRLRLSTGTVAISGTPAVGHVPGVNDPEPVFTVLEHVRERLALLGRPRREAESVPLHGLDPGWRGRELTPYQKQVLGLILAGLARPAVIALDGVDDGLDARERAELWELLEALAADGVAVLVTAREVDPARVSAVVRLSDPQSGEAGRAEIQEPSAYAMSLAGWAPGVGAGPEPEEQPLDPDSVPEPPESPEEAESPEDAEPADEPEPADDAEPADEAEPEEIAEKGEGER